MGNNSQWIKSMSKKASKDKNRPSFLTVFVGGLYKNSFIYRVKIVLLELIDIIFYSICRCCNFKS